MALQSSVSPLQSRLDSLHDQITHLISMLADLDWQSYGTLRLKNIRDDIRALKQKEERLIRSNKQLLSEIVTSSNQLEFYQSKEAVVDILHLDDALCIVNKPADVCIDGDDYITLYKLTENRLNAMGIIVDKLRNCHQLDRATSGVMVYALTKHAAARVSRLFHTRSIIKIYHAIVYGHVASDHFFIDLPLKHSKYKTHLATPLEPGRAAVTECTVLKRGYFTIDAEEESIPVSMLRVHLHTGRRHQIRVHLAHCSHPIIGDVTYWKRSKIQSVRSHLRVLNAQSERMYLDAHRMILNFNQLNDDGYDTNIVDVATHSTYSFAALIRDIDDDDDNKNESHCTSPSLLNSKKPKPNTSSISDALFFPEPHSFDTFNYSMIIPFVVNDDDGDGDDIQILIKKSSRIDMVNFRDNRPRSHHLKGLCWNFVVEAPLKLGHADAAQVISQEMMHQLPQCASYLVKESSFAPSAMTVIPESIDMIESKMDTELCGMNESEIQTAKESNAKYKAHHLASNIRRGVPLHCTICCAPYVIFMVPFSECFTLSPNQDMVWCSLTDLVDEMTCYSPMHLVAIDKTRLLLDPLLHFVLSDERISSMQWIKKHRSERITMNGEERIWTDNYGMKKTPSLSIKVVDNEPCKVLEDTSLFLGSIKAAKNTERLKELEITHIVDCSRGHVEDSNTMIKDEHFVRLQIGVTDTLDADIMKYMDQCLEFIRSALKEGKVVLVHCWAGASRSVSIVIGYLMMYRQMTLKESLVHIQRVRGGFARPNTSFLMQLREMERRIFGKNSYWISDKQMTRYRRKCTVPPAL